MKNRKNLRELAKKQKKNCEHCGKSCAQDGSCPDCTTAEMKAGHDL